MSSLHPRQPYSPEELHALYPEYLKLISAHIFIRHGERAPQSARFQNAGLIEAWPYCNYARHQDLIHDFDEMLGGLRRKSLFQTDSDNQVHRNIAPPKGICQLSQLTDKGMDSTLALGGRLRYLYVHQLDFLPKTIGDNGLIHLRATSYKRAQESLLQVFLGLYPKNTRERFFLPPPVVVRDPEDETLLPNEKHCPRFIQLFKGFSRRTAERWNTSEEMNYVNRRLQRWMPSQQRVAVDSNPPLHGIYDSINSTLPNTLRETRLPDEFYDTRLRSIIDQICTEEEYSGFKESVEYRTLGIGDLLGEVVRNALKCVDDDKTRRIQKKIAKDFAPKRWSSRPPKLLMFGCHDSTLAAILASLGAFEGADETWPPYTSSLAIELFYRQNRNRLQTSHEGIAQSSSGPQENDPGESGCKYYMRLRYNDKSVTIPDCGAPGKHLDGDKTFCTLASFIDIVNQFAPVNWKQACFSNLDKPVFPQIP